MKKHIVELDGLRGLAVLLVMLHHFTNGIIISKAPIDVLFGNIMQRGWIGVDIFFVLSGFLITGILIRSKNANSAMFFTTFYIKRLLRIFPLYYLYLILVFFILFPFIYAKADITTQIKINFARNAEMWFWFYASNIKQIINKEFFGINLGHLWSLAIEEQFYLFWPFVVYFFSMSKLKIICILVIICCLSFRIFLIHFKLLSYILIYSFTLTRIDTIIFGSLIAIVAESKIIKIYSKFCNYAFYVLTFITIFLLTISNEGYEGSIIATIGFSLIGITFSLLILILQSDSKFLLRGFFRKKWLIQLGKYSYSLYLFHPMVRNVTIKIFKSPKLIYNTQIIWNLFFIVICLLASLAVAFVTWNLYEKWFLKLKSKFENKLISSNNH